MPLVEALKRNCLSPEMLLLKVGAKVMFTKNDPEGDYYNGTMGLQGAQSAGQMGQTGAITAGNQNMQGTNLANQYFMQGAEGNAAGQMAANNSLWGGIAGSLGGLASVFGA